MTTLADVARLSVAEPVVAVENEVGYVAILYVLRAQAPEFLALAAEKVGEDQ